ncbi:DUF3310 domain-containing protein [Fusobacterium sp.]|uniref:DUF3310 domain-containing protein n=1 Tax=Fusobacterium sp. TaxID=68766 RepID=UPI0025BEDB4D|nr:DUF3310 domain-containing protein [Fusobacterium sp.]MCI5725505.1 DUF3310 domain-containing protein [Fusobacterium sp.]
MTLGERIKKYRKENVITEKEFANVLGVPIEFLKKVEAGELSIEAPAILDKLKKLIGDIPEPTLNGKTAEEILDGIFGSKVEDNVNSPKHYQIPGVNIESIDIIKVILGDKFIAFCVGNSLKYIIRAEKKNGKEDYEKAKVYLKWAQEEFNKHNILLNLKTANDISAALGVDWLDIISEICQKMSFKKALLLHNVFGYIFNSNYEDAVKTIDRILIM